MRTVLLLAAVGVLYWTVRTLQDANRVYVRALDQERITAARAERIATEAVAAAQLAEVRMHAAWRQSDLVAEAAESNTKGH